VLIFIRICDFLRLALRLRRFYLWVESRMILNRILLPLLFCNLGISDSTLAQPHNILLLLYQQAIQVLLNYRIYLVLALNLIFRSEHVPKSIVYGSEILEFKALLMFHSLVFEDLLSLSDDSLPHLHDFLHVLILKINNFLEGFLVHLDHLAILVFKNS